MQIGAINSFNFKGNHSNEPVATYDVDENGYTVPIDNDEQDGFEYSEPAEYTDEPVETGLAIQNKKEQLANFIKYTKENVHPKTVVATLLVALGTGLAGKTAASYGRKTIITLGEYAAKGVAKAGEAIANVFKKADAPKANAKKVMDKISTWAENLRGKEIPEDFEFTENVAKVVKKSTSEKWGNTVKEFLDKHNITTPQAAFDTVVATGIAVATMDPTSDVLEKYQDTKDIKNYAKELFGDKGTMPRAKIEYHQG